MMTEFSDRWIQSMRKRLDIQRIDIHELLQKVQLQVMTTGNTFVLSVFREHSLLRHFQNLKRMGFEATLLSLNFSSFDIRTLTDRFKNEYNILCCCLSSLYNYVSHTTLYKDEYEFITREYDVAYYSC